MENVKENNYQIDRDGSLASTSTSSCHNSEVCLILFLKKNTWIIVSDWKHEMIDSKSKFKTLNPYDDETITFESEKVKL
jgi:hypothetical protein